MAEFKDRLKLVIEKFEQGSQSNFRLKIGIKSSGHINSWLSGVSKPKYEYLKKICDTYNINEEWLSSGVGEMQKGVYPSVVFSQKEPILEKLHNQWDYENVTPQTDQEKIIWLSAQLKRSEKDLYSFYDRIAGLLMRTETVLQDLITKKEGIHG